MLNCFSFKTLNYARLSSSVLCMYTPDVYNFFVVTEMEPWILKYPFNYYKFGTCATYEAIHHSNI